MMQLSRISINVADSRLKIPCRRAYMSVRFRSSVVKLDNITQLLLKLGDRKIMGISILLILNDINGGRYRIRTCDFYCRSAQLFCSALKIQLDRYCLG